MGWHAPGRGLGPVRRLIAAVLCFAIFVPVVGEAEAAESNVLMVSGDPTSLRSGELAVRERLILLGYGVTIVDDGDASAADAAGVAFVFVGSTVNSGAVGGMFRTVEATVWVAKPWLLDDMGMTGPNAGTDYGSLSSGTIEVVDSAHPMAAGLNGVVTVTIGPQRASFGVPTADADVVATVGGSPTTFVYPAGATLADGSVAAGCRMTASVFQDAPTSFTAEAWSLFEAAAVYAADGCSANPPPPPPPPPPPGPHVVLISADGMRPDAVTSQGSEALPNLYRFIEGGATTDNARSLLEETQTLPNHLSMLTSVSVEGPSGHGVTFNEDDGSTVHVVAGRYVPSIFDVVHDNGFTTSMFAGKPKFDFIDRSWDAVNGAPDVTGSDDGPDKIDMYQRGDGAVVTPAIVDQLTEDPANFTFVHYATPDAAGHAFGWGSPEYLAAVREVDGYVGQIVDAIETDPDLVDTVVVLVADHGGSGLFHAEASLPENYTIPFYVWGAAVPAGVSLYSMNPGSRADPGPARPDYSEVPQPIRNADVGNLVGTLLGLGPIPGSTINAGQDLVVTGQGPPDEGPTVFLTNPADGAVVSGSVTVTADASDDNGVIGVEFFATGASIGVDTDGADGWSSEWDTTGTSPGSVVIEAVATDTSGNSATAAVSVTVEGSGNPKPSVLMISGDAASLSVGEIAVRDRLVAQAFDVAILDDDVASVADADDADFVIVMSTVSTGAVGETFRGTATPVWMAKPWLLDDMGMTGPTGGVDYGQVTSQSIDIVDADHPIADGLIGSVAVTSSARSVSFGIPGGGADIVATAAGAPTIFVYGAGAQLADGSTAAGCRMTLSIFQNVPAAFTADGWRLFDAAARHAASGCPAIPRGDAPPAITVESPVDGSAVAGSVELIATATDDDGVVDVEWLVDGTSVGVDTDGSDGWRVTWDSTATDDGPRSVEALATDTIGQTATDVVLVQVSNSVVAPFVLLVVGNGADPADQDVEVRDRLAALGLAVVIVDDQDVTASDATGSAFVLVASSVSSTGIDPTLFGIAQPLWVAKPFLFDDVGLTGLMANTDYGTKKASVVTIVDETHPMAAGLVGDVPITSSDRSVTWGVVGSEADVVATVGGDPTAFVYRAGARLASGELAPGCRLAFPIFQTALLAYTVDAWSMVAATASYAADGCP